jgi:hypothetical protein
MSRAMAGASKLYPAEDIRWADIDGLVVIMDVRRDGYIVLNEAGSAMWRTLLGAGRPPAEPNDVAGSALSPDSEEFVAECIDRELLVATHSQRPRPRIATRVPRRRFLMARAWWSLLSTALGLRFRGLHREYKSCQEIASVQKSPHEDRVAAAAIRSFALAEEFFWFSNAPDDCLPRSFALFKFLRLLGVPAVHRIGGRRFPAFMMHAWVEYRGVPILDDARAQGDFVLLAEIADA